ncbi:MAG: SH3 domain-containing protein [Caldilineaceae bacterium]|nr:SH3 domain-containing protein [Caldilineaceae bacterium]
MRTPHLHNVIFQAAAAPKFVAVLLILAFLIACVTGPVTALAASPTPTPTAERASSPAETKAAETQADDVIFFQETTTAFSQIMEQPSLLGAKKATLGKGVAVGVIEEFGESKYVNVAYLDVAGNLQDGYINRALLNAPSAASEASLALLKQAIPGESSALRQVAIFESRQHLFDDPTDLSSRNGEILSKGAHIATATKTVNGITWLNIEGEGWVVQRVEGMNIENAQITRELAENEMLTADEKKIGKLPKRAIPHQNMNIRAGTGTANAVVAQATQGTEYIVLSTRKINVANSYSDLWAEIELGDGETGWIALFVGGTEYAQFFDPDPPEGAITDDQRAELEANLDTDWAKPEIEDRLLKTVNAIDPRVVHGEYTNVEGKRLYHQMVFFDADGNVLYHTSNRASEQFLHFVEAGKIKLDEPLYRLDSETGAWVAYAAEGAEASSDGTGNPGNAEAEELDDRDLETKMRELYEPALLEQAEEHGDKVLFSEELGLYTAQFGDIEAVLMPMAGPAAPPSSDPTHTLADSVDQATVTQQDIELGYFVQQDSMTNSEDTVTVNLFNQIKNPVENPKGALDELMNPVARRIVFNKRPAGISKQGLFDAWIEDSFVSYPQFWPPQPNQKYVFNIAFSSREGDDYQTRLANGEQEAGFALSKNSQWSHQERLIVRQAGDTIYFTIIHFPGLTAVKNIYFQDPETGELYDEGRQAYGLPSFDRSLTFTLGDMIFDRYLGLDDVVSDLDQWKENNAALIETVNAHGEPIELDQDIAQLSALFALE